MTPAARRHPRPKATSCRAHLEPGGAEALTTVLAFARQSLTGHPNDQADDTVSTAISQLEGSLRATDNQPRDSK
ncbi:MAG TPA: hypothetical protein VMB74_03710 [Streptosporangiaceae bacterium]|nr:hypothetical protein [Streptosporangiaceae bacterium]